MAAGEIEKVTITITTRNAPFCDEHANPERNRADWTVLREVARIVRGIAVRGLHPDGEEITLRDDFGHECGTITVEREAYVSSVTAEQIAYWRAENEAERLSWGELADIQGAFAEIDPSTLPEPAENAGIDDMLDELEARL